MIEGRCILGGGGGVRPPALGPPLILAIYRLVLVYVDE